MTKTVQDIFKELLKIIFEFDDDGGAAFFFFYLNTKTHHDTSFLIIKSVRKKKSRLSDKPASDIILVTQMALNHLQVLPILFSPQTIKYFSSLCVICVGKLSYFKIIFYQCGKWFRATVQYITKSKFVPERLYKFTYFIGIIKDQGRPTWGTPGGHVPLPPKIQDFIE